MKAEVNDVILTSKGIIGLVKTVYENSVIIKVLENPTDFHYRYNITVVNHKNYMILQKSFLRIDP